MSHRFNCDPIHNNCAYYITNANLGCLKLSTRQITLSYINQTECFDVTFPNDNDNEDCDEYPRNSTIQLSQTWMPDQEYTINFQRKSITIIILDDGK